MEILLWYLSGFIPIIVWGFCVCEDGEELVYPLFMAIFAGVFGPLTLLFMLIVLAFNEYKKRN